MATRTFELSTHVPVPPEAALDFLADLGAHTGMHAYLVSAQIVARSGDVTDWRVTERPAVGPFRYTIRFPARMRRISPRELSGSVKAAPGCTLTTRTTATPASGGAHVSEVTTVTAPALLVAYMARHARIAHQRTFSMLARELAARA